MLSGAALSSLGAGSADAAFVSIDFENINLTYPSPDKIFIQHFYNGGTSSVGTSGTNYRVSCGENVLNVCLNSLGEIFSNTSRGGLGDPTPQNGALFILTGSKIYLSYASGFDTGFSFNCTSANHSGSVTFCNELNGLGTPLARLSLILNVGSCPGCNAGFCPYTPIGVLFSGKEKSIGFGGVTNQIAFDDPSGRPAGDRGRGCIAPAGRPTVEQRRVGRGGPFDGQSCPAPAPARLGHQDWLLLPDRQALWSLRNQSVPPSEFLWLGFLTDEAP